MDHRDMAALRGEWYDSLDEKRMIATVEDDNGEPVEIAVVWQVCDTCQGHGKHVNPSIDSHGLTAEDFDANPDFREDYMGGVYDVPCYECSGRRVVPAPDPDDPNYALVEKLQREQDEYAQERAMEMRYGY